MEEGYIRVKDIPHGAAEAYNRYLRERATTLNFAASDAMWAVIDNQWAGILPSTWDAKLRGQTLRLEPMDEAEAATFDLAVLDGEGLTWYLHRWMIEGDGWVMQAEEDWQLANPTGGCGA